MEALTFSAYNFGGYPGYFPFYHEPGKFKQNWNKKGTYGLVPDVPDYFDFYKRAQLKAVLSQVNPNLTSRLRKANTKECGVQVNPKVNATVQCSLGPKTLCYRDVKWEREGALSPPNVRFSRPVAIYSPVFDRRFVSMTASAVQRQTLKRGAEVEKAESENQRGFDHRQQSTAKNQAASKFNFQFLEQKYGYYHCGKCSIRWESAYVWCISGTCKVYFRQHCRKCQAGLNPYRVESIQCQVCAQTSCCCEQKQRHIDLRRPHRQDLCGRCKGKTLSCDATYSFKYIV